MWPMSRQNMPKHFLPLFNGKSLFELSYGLLRERYTPNDIYLQTNELQANLAFSLCPDIVKNNVFIEPETRDQGPATGFMAARLFNLFPDEPFMVIQADVFRSPPEKFFAMVDTAEKLVLEKQVLVTTVLKTNQPVMGVDYLKVDPNYQTINEVKAYKVESWLGRDSSEQVISGYLAENRVMLHNNHYCATPRQMLDLFKKHTPDWYEPLFRIASLSVNNISDPSIALEYQKMAKAGIERMTQHALVENGIVLESNFEWVDFGSWASVARYQKENKLYRPENLIEIDSQNNYVTVPNNKQVALIGLNNVTVVDTPDGLLVCSNDSTGKVGEVVEKLKEQGKDKYL